MPCVGERYKDVLELENLEVEGSARPCWIEDSNLQIGHLYNLPSESCLSYSVTTKTVRECTTWCKGQ
jgi:hypothetical protein